MSNSHADQTLAPGLYIGATPIGNLGDITLRCLEALRSCDAVACEDTRVAGKLLNHFEIRKPLWRYNDHSSDNERKNLLAAIREKSVVLISDAGTPVISDPGLRLIREARASGIPVTSLPGPCAAICALTLSGLPSDRFLFAGFLPVKEKARRAVFEDLSTVRATLVFYETAPRLTKTLASLRECWPHRMVAVARELTKFYEECRTGTADELLRHYQEHPARGEIVLLIEPPGDQTQEFDVDELLHEALADLKPSQAAASVAKQTGQDRKALYARALELRTP